MPFSTAHILRTLLYLENVKLPLFYKIYIKGSYDFGIVCVLYIKFGGHLVKLTRWPPNGTVKLTIQQDGRRIHCQAPNNHLDHMLSDDMDVLVK